jgi:hypothetical protein
MNSPEPGWPPWGQLAIRPLATEIHDAEGHQEQETEESDDCPDRAIAIPTQEL